jgi:hypothetical protein
MMHHVIPGFMILAFLPACAPRTNGALAPLRVYATSAASPWLQTAYDCAPMGSAIELTTPDEADLVLRLTEPRSLNSPAFQVGVDDLLVVTHPEAAVGPLSAAQVQAIFTGQINNWIEVGGADREVRVWTFSPTVDIQAFFDRVILQDRPVTSTARLAVSAQDMSDSVGSIPGSVGLLPRRWKAGNTREALMVSTVPVLGLTRQPPQGALADLVSCLQEQP